MKKISLAVIIFCFLVTGFALSQNGPPKHKKEGKRQSAEEMVKQEMKMLKEDLSLTETQEVFVQKILTDSYKKMEENFKNENKDRDEMKKIMDEKDNNIKSVLTDEQWEKYKAIKDRMKDKFKQGDDKDRPSGPPDRH